ncbi:tetratricopeptide repeat protein [Streptomyces sp. NPDC002755]|uniref:tetratricopeptide repeat protein n=1 Tax=Streptomyces sp. NPDC002884 TaxID=3154544 RepID=UPI0033267C39
MPKLVNDNREAPAPKVLRIALYSWVHRFVLGDDGTLRPRLDVDEPPAEIVTALDWIGRKSVDITTLNAPSVVRMELDALKLKQDGTVAAENTALFRACAGHGADDRRSRTAIASALNAVGWGHVLLGRYQQALDHCRQALALCLELGDDINAAHTWDSVGYAHHHLGQYEEAVTAFHQALALYRRQGDLPWFVAGALTHLGDTHLSAGAPDAARAAWTEALTIMDDLGHTDAESLRTRLNP